MNIQMVAVLIQEGSRLVSEWLKFRPNKATASPLIAISQETSKTTNTQPVVSKATAITTGCIPCALGHFSTCSGLLPEAMRFARSDGIQSDEVINRANRCLEELNAMEREDLRPEMIIGLSDWEKEIVNQALTESRKIRHDLESFSNIAQLELVAAHTQTVRQDIGRAWFKAKLERMSPAEKEETVKKVMAKLEENNA